MKIKEVIASDQFKALDHEQKLGVIDRFYSDEVQRESGLPALDRVYTRNADILKDRLNVAHAYKNETDPTLKAVYQNQAVIASRFNKELNNAPMGSGILGRYDAYRAEMDKFNGLASEYKDKKQRSEVGPKIGKLATDLEPYYPRDEEGEEFNTLVLGLANPDMYKAPSKIFKAAVGKVMSKVAGVLPGGAGDEVGQLKGEQQKLVDQLGEERFAELFAKGRVEALNLYDGKVTVSDTIAPGLVLAKPGNIFDDDIVEAAKQSGASDQAVAAFEEKQLPAMRQVVSDTVASLKLTPDQINKIETSGSERQKTSKAYTWSKLSDEEFTKRLIMEYREKGGFSAFVTEAEASLGDLVGGLESLVGASERGELVRKRSDAIKILNKENPSAQLIKEFGALTPDILISLGTGFAGRGAALAGEAAPSVLQRISGIGMAGVEGQVARSISAASLAAGATAGTKTFGEAQDLGLDYADSAKAGLTSFLVNAGVTRAFGARGVDKAFDMPGAKQAWTQFFGGAFKEAASEGLEEASAAALEHMLVVAQMNPDATPAEFADSFVESMRLGALAGGVVSGLTGLPGQMAKQVSDSIAQSQAAGMEQTAQAVAEAAQEQAAEGAIKAPETPQETPQEPGAVETPGAEAEPAEGDLEPLTGVLEGEPEAVTEPTPTEETTPEPEAEEGAMPDPMERLAALGERLRNAQSSAERIGAETEARQTIEQAIRNKSLKAPNGSPVTNHFVTGQGSVYMVTEDGQTLRFKSYHLNTAGEDAGLRSWKPAGQRRFIEASQTKHLGLAVSILKQGGVPIRFREDGNTISVEAYNRNTGQWQKALWSDAMPKAFGEGKSFSAENGVIEAQFSTAPETGKHLIEWQSEDENGVKGFHPGSEVTEVFSPADTQQTQEDAQAPIEEAGEAPAVEAQSVEPIAEAEVPGGTEVAPTEAEQAQAAVDDQTQRVIDRLPPSKRADVYTKKSGKLKAGVEKGKVWATEQFAGKSPEEARKFIDKIRGKLAEASKKSTAAKTYSGSGQAQGVEQSNVDFWRGAELVANAHSATNVLAPRKRRGMTEQDVMEDVVDANKALYYAGANYYYTIDRDGAVTRVDGEPPKALDAIVQDTYAEAEAKVRSGELTENASEDALDAIVWRNPDSLNEARTRLGLAPVALPYYRTQAPTVEPITEVPAEQAQAEVATEDLPALIDQFEEELDAEIETTRESLAIEEDEDARAIMQAEIARMEELSGQSPRNVEELNQLRESAGLDPVATGAEADPAILDEDAQETDVNRIFAKLSPEQQERFTDVTSTPDYEESQNLDIIRAVRDGTPLPPPAMPTPAKARSVARTANRSPNTTQGLGDQLVLPLSQEAVDGVKPIAAPEVMTALADIVQAVDGSAPVRVGFLRGNRNRGEYWVQPEMIRVKTANDIRAAGHEVGHAIDATLYEPNHNWKTDSAITTAAKAELKRLGKVPYPDSEPSNGWESEGFAEFIHVLTFNGYEAARAAAPRFAAYFDTQVLADRPALKQSIEKAQDASRRFSEQGPVARVRESIAPPKGVMRRAVERLQQWRKDLVPELIDSGAPIKKFFELAQQKSATALDAKDDPSLTLTARSMAHDSVVEKMIEENMLDFMGNKVGGSLDDAIAGVRKRTGDFTVYLYALRAKALLEDPNGPRNPGISAEDAAAVINQFDSPSFRVAAQKVEDWNNGVLDYVAQASPDYADAVEKIRARDPGSYIPLFREFSMLDQVVGSSSSAKSGNVSKALIGSGRRIKEPFGSMISQARSMVLKANQKRVLDQILKLAMEVPGMGHMVVEVPRSQIPVAHRSVAEVIAEIEKKTGGEVMVQTDDGIKTIRDEELSSDMEQVLAFFAPAYAPTKKGENPVVPIFYEGKLRWFEVDHSMFEALSGMDIKHVSGIAQWLLAAPTRAFRMGTTGLRPAFSLFTNPLRDLQSAMLNSRASANPAQFFGTWMQEIGKAFLHVASGGKFKSEWIDLYERLGGKMATSLGQDKRPTIRAVRRLSEGRVVRTLDARNWVDYIRDVLQFPELATRAAETRLVAKDMGIIDASQPLTEVEGAKLITAGKQVSTDFTASGKLVSTLNQMVPFLNASIQGPRAHIIAGKRSPMRFFSRALTLTALSLANWWKNKDEEWWEEMTPEERYGYEYFPIDINGKQELLRIPRPFEAGGIFQAGAQASAEAWYKEEPEHMTDWMTTFLTNFTPSLPPTLLEPAQQLANKNFYFDAPIVPEGERDKPLEEQVGPFTTRVAASLGTITGTSPRRIDHAIRSIFGGGGSDIVALFGKGSGNERESEPSDIPVLGTAFQRGGQAPRRAKSLEEFYDAIEETKRIQRSSRTEETPEQKNLRLMMSDAQNAIAAISDIRNLEWSTEQRRAMDKLRRDVARDALDAYRAGDTKRNNMAATRKKYERQADKAEDAARNQRIAKRMQELLDNTKSKITP